MSSLIRASPEDLPDGLRQRFERVQERLTAVKATADEGDVVASLNEMSEDEAAEIATEIVELYHAVRNLDQGRTA